MKIVDATSCLTIVSYHYVRPIRDSQYASIKGLEKTDFEGQMKYIMRHYNVVSMEHVVASIRGEEQLPQMALLLTFDDGFSDHYLHVFPHLVQHGISAAFYPSVSPTVERKMLDVHKIHFILACESNKIALVDSLNEHIEQARESFDLEPIHVYEKDYKNPNRYDSGEVIYIKRMLQHALPDVLRKEITDNMFGKFVTNDQSAFADELYLNEEQLKIMIAEGMHVGGHGVHHEWLNHCDKSHQESIVRDCRGFLDSIGVSSQYMTFCYPYGAYNDDTKAIIARHGFDLALTTEVGVADLCLHDNYMLPRLDTNDLPKSCQAETVSWTRNLM